MSNKATRIAISTGEPAGIGPDLCLKWMADPPIREGIECVFLGCAKMLQARAKALGLSVACPAYDCHQVQPYSILDCPTLVPVIAGQLAVENAPSVLNLLERGIDGCLSGEFSAFITAPLHKGIINEAGIPFSGHTEFLAQRCGVDEVVMMLAGGGLRVALATTHLPLAHVPKALTQAKLERVIRILHTDLQQHFGLDQPRILVAAVNPHAGEDGHMGREEIDIQQPVLNRLRAEGMNLKGPFPADTLFTHAVLKEGDAVLAMYHDQGLPTLKYASFGEGINITLGLPMIRTSVDHGTALALAGTGQIHSGSFNAALNLAIELAHKKAKRA